MNYTKAVHEAEHKRGGYACRWCTQDWRVEAIGLVWANDFSLYEEIHRVGNQYAERLTTQRPMSERILISRLIPIVRRVSEIDRSLSGVGGVDSLTVIRRAAAEIAAELIEFQREKAEA